MRDVEALGKTKATPLNPRRAAPEKDPDTRALEKRLSETLGLASRSRGRERPASCAFAIATLDQLDELCRRLGLD